MGIQQHIITFLNDFLLIMSEMAPYLLLGFFFAGLLHAFIPQRIISHSLNGKPLKSAILASLFGIPLPLCSCGVIPTGTALYKKGASKGGSISFLISTPQTGVDSILASFSLLGLPFAIIRPIAALITGITGGLITSTVTKKESDQRTFKELKVNNKPFLRKLVDVFHYGFIEFIQDISKWLVIGLLLAALISALIPHDFFEWLHLPPIVQMILILIISIPLYICATGSIPLAAVLILKGLSPGAAFVLLMAGPATNAATITMIGNVLGRKSLMVYLLTIIGGALSFGLLIDYILPSHWFLQTIEQHSVHYHNNNLEWWKLFSMIILSLLIINGFILKHKKKNKMPQSTPKQMTTKTINVTGMTCNHCKKNVETQLLTLKDVNTVDVDLSSKTVTISAKNIDEETICQTIEGLGYKVEES